MDTIVLCKCGCGEPATLLPSGWKKGHWNRNGNAKWSEERRRDYLGVREKYDESEIFVVRENRTLQTSQLVRNYYTRRRKRSNTYVCDECGNDGMWRGKKLTLQIDHKNGQHNDDTIENLQLLCPNCHAQTPTFGGGAKRGKKRTSQRGNDETSY